MKDPEFLVAKTIRKSLKKNSRLLVRKTFSDILKKVFCMSISPLGKIQSNSPELFLSFRNFFEKVHYCGSKATSGTFDEGLLYVSKN